MEENSSAQGENMAGSCLGKKKCCTAAFLCVRLPGVVICLGMTMDPKTWRELQVLTWCSIFKMTDKKTLRVSRFVCTKSQIFLKQAAGSRTWHEMPGGFQSETFSNIFVIKTTTTTTVMTKTMLCFEHLPFFFLFFHDLGQKCEGKTLSLNSSSTSTFVFVFKIGAKHYQYQSLPATLIICTHSGSVDT